MMFKKIVVAVDAEGLAASTLPVVAALARPAGAEVFVLHVRDVENELRSSGDARAVLDAAIDELNAAGVPASGELRWIADGHPARAISRVAEARGADLVAIGSHGRTELGALVLGSVGNEVAAQVPASLLVTRPATGAEHFERGQAARIRRVLLGVAVGEPTELGEYAARLCRDLGARLKVVHIRQLVAVAEASAYVEPEGEAFDAVRSARAAAAAIGVDADVEVIEGGGAVARELVGVADDWNADLIVLGSRRPSRLDGLFMGSVAHQVIHLTRRAVLLAQRAVRVTQPISAPSVSRAPAPSLDDSTKKKGPALA